MLFEMLGGNFQNGINNVCEDETLTHLSNHAGEHKFSEIIWNSVKIDHQESVQKIEERKTKKKR